MVAAHKAFVAAGAEIVISASYQAPDDLLAESVRVARQAGVLVAASVAPYGASLAGGEEYTGDYEVPDGFHERRLRLLLAAEPDCIAVETQPRLDEAAAIVRLLEELDAPDAWVTFTCRDGERTAHGERIEDAIAAVESPKVVAVGVNCTAPRVRRRAAAACSDGDGQAADRLPERGPHVRRGLEDLERRRAGAGTSRARSSSAGAAGSARPRSARCTSADRAATATGAARARRRRRRG